MMRPTRQGRIGGPANRGSAILLVIAILSILVLLAITLSFTSRLEVASAENFANGVQNRVATETGVEEVAFALAYQLPSGPTGKLDLALSSEHRGQRERAIASESLAWRGFRLTPATLSQPAVTAAATQQTSNRSLRTNASGALIPYHETENSEVVVLDASARVNVNAAPYEVLAGFFDAHGAESGHAVDADALARAIVAVRLGPDGAPGKKDFDDDYDTREGLAELLREENPELAGRLDLLLPELLQSIREPYGDLPEGEEEWRAAARKALMTNTDESDEYVADLRLPPLGDDIRFGKLSDLLRYELIRDAGLTPELLESARPYLTVFSASEDDLLRADAIARVDANRATAEEIRDGLRTLYGDSGKNGVLLTQFAANVADARDFDSVPTIFHGSTREDTVLGFERTPYITEVYPDSLTDDGEGDDGQFVELYNPWTEPFDLTGWSLRGAGTAFAITGSIAPKGYLILTDDLDSTSDDSEDLIEGTGSLYHVFGVVANGRQRRALESAGFALPHTTSGPVTVELVNADGDLVDQFTYRPGARPTEGIYSFQRTNPLVRSVERLRATPFGLPAAELPDDPDTFDRLALAPMNGPFADVTDVLMVFAGFHDADSGEENLWGYPVLATPKSPRPDDALAAADPLAIDARVVDLLTVGTTPPAIKAKRTSRNEQVASLFAADTRQDIAASYSRGDVDDLAVQRLTGVALGRAVTANVRHGLINVNTAPETVLAAVPGFGARTAAVLAERRGREESQARAGGLGDGLLYHRLSDLLVDDALYGGGQGVSREERLARFRSIAPYVAFNSRSFVLVGQPKLATESGQDLQEALRTEWLVATDRGTPETIARRPAR